MPTIRHPAKCCTVIVTVDAAPEHMPTLIEHAKSGLARFAAFDGYIGGALHFSDADGRIVQYLQWRSEQHHLACMNDPSWNELASARAFMDLVTSGAAVMKVGTFDVVAAVDAGE
jgi:hypothetical protein